MDEAKTQLPSLKDAKGRTITPKQLFEDLLSIQCTQAEVLSVFHVSRNTLRKWVRENYDGRSYDSVSEEFLAAGRTSIRRALFRHAIKNPGAAIFLAKNYLGMSDDPHPLDTGEERREFAMAMKAAVKVLEETDITAIADVPNTATETEETKGKEISSDGNKESLAE